MFVVGNDRSLLLNNTVRDPENEMQGSWIVIKIRDDPNNHNMTISEMQMMQGFVFMYIILIW